VTGGCFRSASNSRMAAAGPESIFLSHVSGRREACDHHYPIKTPSDSRSQPQLEAATRRA
jgi:hypothetical protein